MDDEQNSTNDDGLEARITALLDARFKAQEDFLHGWFRRIVQRQDRAEQYLLEIRTRQTDLARSLAAVRREVASDAETVAGVEARVDRLDDRIKRIEARLDLGGEP